jgi:pantetheine-phosphate adenylyltransferase
MRNKAGSIEHPVIAVYPGSFDPVTHGHIDIIKRGSKIFDAVVVGVLRNVAKEQLFSVAEREVMMRDAVADLPNVQVKSFDGLLIDFVLREKARVIVRGIRAISDFEYEFQMALMNRKLDSNIETVFMMPSMTYTFLSSKLVKEVAALGADVKGLVPDSVAIKLKKKLGL